MASAAPPSPASAAAAPGAAPAARVPVCPPDMLFVPGGTFTMGADSGGENDEHPAHAVTVAGFCYDRLEVSNGRYLECVRAGACKPYRDDAAASMHLGPERAFRGATQPVMGVSWFDAGAYCAWRDAARLPTEAEWERAARGGDDRRYVWGNDAPDRKKHGCFQSCETGVTMPVGSYPAGAARWGQLDLAGNVWEWTADYYDPYAYRRAGAAQGVPGSCDEIRAAQDELRKSKQQGFTGTNPIPTECERVLRGGAFNYHPQGLRVSNRVHHPGTWRLLVAGFRCAKTP